MQFRIVFWDVLPCKIIVDRLFRGACWLHHQGCVAQARSSETSVDSYFTRQYIPEDKSELHIRRRENLKSQTLYNMFYNARMVLFKTLNAIKC
jgi:hypothetical protein